VFVERDAAAARVLKGNLASLGIAGEAVEVRQVEALKALREANARQETYDLVFIDPPYGRARPTPATSASSIADGWGPRLSAILPALLSPGARVVVESDRRAPIALDFAIERSRRYGDTSITIHRHQ
jgi:16S rRNA (guanine966-N2)-methyltransferase